MICGCNPHLLPVSSERRRAFRLPVDVPARVTVSAGHEFPVRLLDISDSGVRFEMHADRLATLLPNVLREDLRLPVEIRLHFRLPCAHEGEICIVCGVLHAIKATNAVLHVGAQYRELAQDAANALMDFCTICLASTDSNHALPAVWADFGPD